MNRPPPIWAKERNHTTHVDHGASTTLIHAAGSLHGSTAVAATAFAPASDRRGLAGFPGGFAPLDIGAKPNPVAADNCRVLGQQQLRRQHAYGSRVSMPARFEPALWSPRDELAVRKARSDCTALTHSRKKYDRTRPPQLTSPKSPFCSFATLLLRSLPSAARSSSSPSVRPFCLAWGRHGLRIRRPIHDLVLFSPVSGTSLMCSSALSASTQAASHPVSTVEQRPRPSPAWVRRLPARRTIIGLAVPVPVAHGALWMAVQ